MTPAGRKWLFAALIAWGMIMPVIGWWVGFKFGAAVTLAGWQKRADHLGGEIRSTGKKVKAVGLATADAILTKSARLVNSADDLVSFTKQTTRATADAILTGSARLGRKADAMVSSTKEASHATTDAILTGTARLVKKKDALVSNTQDLVASGTARLKSLIKRSDKQTTK